MILWRRLMLSQNTGGGEITYQLTMASATLSLQEFLHRWCRCTTDRACTCHLSLNGMVGHNANCSLGQLMFVLRTQVVQKSFFLQRNVRMKWLHGSSGPDRQKSSSIYCSFGRRSACWRLLQKASFHLLSQSTHQLNFLTFIRRSLFIVKCYQHNFLWTKPYHTEDQFIT